MICGPERPSPCRRSSASIVSDPSRVGKLRQRRASFMTGQEFDHGLVHGPKIQCKLLAGRHPLQEGHVEVEVRCLAPRNDGLVWTTAHFWRIDGRKHQRTAVEDQRYRTSRANIADLPIIAWSDVNP